eukprot:1335905-Amphidinium_carterae.1
MGEMLHPTCYCGWFPFVMFRVYTSESSKPHVLNFSKEGFFDVEARVSGVPTFGRLLQNV